MALKIGFSVVLWLALLFGAASHKPVHPLSGDPPNCKPGQLC